MKKYLRISLAFFSQTATALLRLHSTAIGPESVITLQLESCDPRLTHIGGISSVMQSITFLSNRTQNKFIQISITSKYLSINADLLGEVLANVP